MLLSWGTCGRTGDQCRRPVDIATNENAMYTTREAADLLCCHIHTLRNYIVSGKLRAVRRGDGNYLIHANDLRAFLGLDPDEALVCSVEDEP